MDWDETVSGEGTARIGSDLTVDEQRAWKQWVIAHSRLTNRLDQGLGQRNEMTLADYDVLLNLSQAEGGRLRMNELAEYTRLSPSGLTRRFDALCRRGWVERERCDNDRRGVFAVLTDEGRTRVEAATPGHVDEVRRLFADVLDADELQTLTKITQRVLDRLDTVENSRSTANAAW